MTAGTPSYSYYRYMQAHLAIVGTSTSSWYIVAATGTLGYSRYKHTQLVYSSSYRHTWL